MKQFKFFIFFLVISINTFFQLAYAQKQGKEEIDSILLTLDNKEKDTNIIKAWLSLSDAYQFINPDSGLYFGNLALDLCRDLKWGHGERRALLKIGTNYSRMSAYDQALNAFNESIGKSKIAKDSATLSSGLGLTCIAYINMGNTEKALEYVLKSIEIDDKLKNKYVISQNYNLLGIIYADMKQHEKAIVYYEKSLALALELKEKRNIAYAYSNTGSSYQELNQFSKAIPYHLKALKIEEELKDYYGLATEYGSLCDAYIGLYKSNNTQSKSFLLDSAIYFSKEGIKYSYLCSDHLDRINILFSLSKAYKLKKEYSTALEIFEEATALKDSIFSEDNRKQISAIETRQQAKIHEKEIQILESRKKLERIYFIVGGIVLLILMISLYYRFRYMKKIKHQLEEKNVLIEKEKIRAEQSEQFKQQFLANMSHEIRTPMNAVMGMTNLLIEKNPRQDQKMYLDSIHKSSEVLLHIINDILDLSKIEAGKMELESIDFSIRELVEQVKLTLNHKAEEKGLHLFTDIDPTIPEVVIGDPTRLNQILVNLTGNAIKFTEKGSISIKLVQTHDKIRFEVTDTGIGIPPEKIASVFESFSQANASDTRKYGGTGLGLSISKQLVEKMGGQIGIESEVGAGTMFYFELLLEQGSVQNLTNAKAGGTLDSSVLQGLKILIVDDNEYNLIVVRDTLSAKAELAITEARNGQEAVDLFKENEFDLILMDVQMPVMDGYEATRLIRSSFPAPKNEIPIIALTASVVRSDLDKCRQAGMNDYVPKPFKTSQLVGAIAKACGREIRYTIQQTSSFTSEKIQKTGITDLSYLEKFCDGDQIRMKKYIKMFLDSAPALIEKIETARQTGNFEDIPVQIHAYKTKWIMMGMNETKDLALTIENQYATLPPDSSASDNLDKLIQNIRLAIKELSS